MFSTLLTLHIRLCANKIFLILTYLLKVRWDATVNLYLKAFSDLKCPKDARNDEGTPRKAYLKGHSTQN